MDVAPSETEKVLSGQLIQVELPSEEYVPIGQSIQLEPAVEYFPGKQLEQIVAPGVDVCPAGQSRQVLLPVFEEYFPALQSVQIAELLVLENLPLTHRGHLV